MKMNTLTAGTTAAVVAVLAAVSVITTGWPDRDEAATPDKFVGETSRDSATPVLTKAYAARADFTVDLVTEQNGPLFEDGGDILFCLPLVFPEATCLPRDGILKLDGRPIDRLTPDGAPRFESLLMVHPKDFREPEREVRTCEVFGRLKTEEWGAMTTKGMAAEARFERYCGLMALARLAQPPRTSRFSEAQLTETEIESLPGEAWPQLGEELGHEPIFAQDDKDRRRWVGNSETLYLTVQDVALADFDDDGFAERLLAVAGRARGGSAGFSGYMLLEHDDQGMGLRRIVWK